MRRVGTLTDLQRDLHGFALINLRVQFSRVDLRMSEDGLRCFHSEFSTDVRAECVAQLVWMPAMLLAPLLDLLYAQVIGWRECLIARSLDRTAIRARRVMVADSPCRRGLVGFLPGSAVCSACGVALACCFPRREQTGIDRPVHELPNDQLALRTKERLSPGTAPTVLVLRWLIAPDWVGHV